MEPRKFGKYELMERIGSGGMADVYKARFQGPEGFTKTVALKLIAESHSERPEHVRMFIQEANLVANLEHSNIVRVHEFHKLNGRYYIEMEIVQGEDLAAILKMGVISGRFPTVPEALAIALEACRGLAYAHSDFKKEAPVIIHRDISPQNIMVAETGEVKITDFGVAKLLSAPNVTKSGIIKGKASYVSPEHVKGLDLDNRSDIFSLGVVLWEMLSAKRLFKGSSDYETIQNLMQGSITPPSAAKPEVTTELDQVVLSMLARDREQRPRSASAVIDNLSRILGRITTEDRTQIIRKMYREMTGREPDSSTREISTDTPGEPYPSAVSVDIPINTDHIGMERFQAGTRPDRPAIGRPMQEPAQKRRRPRLWPAAAFMVVLAGTVVYLEVTGGRGGNKETTTADSATKEAVKPTTDTPEPKAAEPASVDDKTPASPEGSLEASELEKGDDSGGERTDDKPETTAASNKPAKTIGKRPKSRRRKKPGRRKTVRGLFGKITVEAIPPGAKVFVGEKYLGRTPLKEIPVPVGRHSMILIGKDEKRKQHWINVQEGKTTSYVVLVGEGS